MIITDFDVILAHFDKDNKNSVNYTNNNKTYNFGLFFKSELIDSILEGIFDKFTSIFRQ